jgi:negative regulator of sigma E activity
MPNIFIHHSYSSSLLCLSLSLSHVSSSFACSDAIIQAILQANFDIRYEKTYIFRPDELESLYIKHRNHSCFQALVNAYTA